MSAVRDIKGKIEIHKDRAAGSIKLARAYFKDKNYSEVIRHLIDAQFHQAMVEELKSVKP
jgi:hypothetical protein